MPEESRLDKIQNTNERKKLEWSLKEKEHANRKKDKKDNEDGSKSRDLDN